MDENEIASLVRNLAAGIRSIDSSQSLEEKIIEADVVKNSIKEKSVTCLECGKVFKILSSRHLALHGLSPAEYKAKYGLKPKTSLISKSLQRERKKKMLDMKLWERRGKKAEAPQA
jgi:predicted transcriptional regulator